MNPNFSDKYFKCIIAIILSGMVLFADCSVSPRYTRSSRQNRQSQSDHNGSEKSATHYSKDHPYSEVGYASFYANKFNGRKTASGERYYKNVYTAAHRSLPFNTLIKVTNVSNNKSVVLRINDRGPFAKNRILDISRCAAEDLGIIRSGIGKVKVEVID